MRSLPVLPPLPWVTLLDADLCDGLPKRRRELVFLRVDRAPSQDERVEALPLKAAA